MSVQMVRFTAAMMPPADTTTRIKDVFDAVRAAAPPGIRYTAVRDDDAPVFTLILELDDGVTNPLPAIAEAASFRDWLLTKAGDDARPRSCTIIGRYEA